MDSTILILLILVDMLYNMYYLELGMLMNNMLMFIQLLDMANQNIVISINLDNLQKLKELQVLINYFVSFNAQ
jgi:hypothetical protein